MKESDERNHHLTWLGSPGTPERSAVIPKYNKSDTLDWASRMPQILNSHAAPDRYLTRTLQGYIDGQLLYSENIYPDRSSDTYDGAVWDSAAVDYSAPATRHKLGIKWSTSRRMLML